MHTVRANFAQVKASRDVFMLLLGTSVSGSSQKDEIRVALSEQILLNPSAAKKLALMLNEAIRVHESEFGPLDDKVLRHKTLIPTPKLRPPAFRSPEGARKVETCFRLITKFDIRPAFERSFQIQEKKLLTNRFLLGFDAHSVVSENILHICESMGMPPDLMADFTKFLPEASVIGFGFGEDETTCIVRAYLEFKIRFFRAREEKPTDHTPYLSHLGFKWDASDSRIGVTTKYTCHPGYTTADVVEAISKIPYPERLRATCDIVRRILNRAADKVGDDKFLFLNVDEENNLRNSFDINLYHANLKMHDVHSFLSEISHLYYITESAFDELYGTINTHVLGHIAGGIDRKGTGFLTVYFGE